MGPTMSQMLKRVFCWLCIALICFSVACDDTSYGEGIGRPKSKDAKRVGLSDIAIAEVYLADALPSEHFVEIVLAADAAQSLDLENFVLQGAKQDVSIILLGSLDPGSRTSFAIDELNLSASAGELAVVDVDGNVHAYVAWGSDPSVWQTNLYAQAVVNGITEAGSFVRLPYPMTLGVAVAFEGTEEGCALPSKLEEASIDASLCQRVPVPLEITEMMPCHESRCASFVEIENLGATNMRLDGVRLCQMDSCFAFAYNTQIDAGSRLLVKNHCGEENSEQNTQCLPDKWWIRLDTEIFLLAPGTSMVSAGTDALVSYVCLGTLDPTVRSLAAAGGLWPETVLCAPSPRLPDESLSLNAASVWDKQSWDIQQPPWNPTFPPTPLAQNQSIGSGIDAWYSCSFVPPWKSIEPFDVVIQRVDWADPATIMLAHAGVNPDAIALDTLAIALGDVVLFLDQFQTSLASGESLVVELDPEQDCQQGNGHVCWSDPNAELHENSEITLLDVSLGFPQAEVLQHIQWGTGGLRFGQKAVDAGVWPLLDCALLVLEVGQAIVLVPTFSGHSPADYVIEAVP